MDLPCFSENPPRMYLADDKRITSKLSEYNCALERFYGAKLTTRPVKLFFLRDQQSFAQEISPIPKQVAMMIANSYFYGIYIIQPENLQDGARIAIPGIGYLPFWPVVSHEMQHCFFFEIARCSAPFWLNEGLSEMFSWGVANNCSRDQVLSALDCFEEIDLSKYGAAHFIVDRLINLFGQEKIVELLMSMKQFIKNEKLTIFSKKHFAQCFLQVYGVPFEKDKIADLVCG